jgi:RNA polymerase sigma-70 factor, ECF subfamily
MVRRKILRIVRNREDAEDLLQETLLRAYTHILSFRRSCKFSTWMSAIGVNLALMKLRKRRAHKENQPDVFPSDPEGAQLWDPIDPSPGPDRMYQRRQAALLIRREMGRLPKNLRTVVELYYGHEHSMEAMAEALDISVAAVKTRLVRARIRLRSRMAKYGIEHAGD